MYTYLPFDRTRYFDSYYANINLGEQNLVYFSLGEKHYFCW